MSIENGLGFLEVLLDQHKGKQGHPLIVLCIDKLKDIINIFGKKGNNKQGCKQEGLNGQKTHAITLFYISIDQ